MSRRRQRDTRSTSPFSKRMMQTAAQALTKTDEPSPSHDNTVSMESFSRLKPSASASSPPVVDEAAQVRLLRAHHERKSSRESFAFKPTSSSSSSLHSPDTGNSVRRAPRLSGHFTRNKMYRINNEIFQDNRGAIPRQNCN